MQVHKGYTCVKHNLTPLKIKPLNNIRQLHSYIIIAEKLVSASATAIRVTSSLLHQVKSLFFFVRSLLFKFTRSSRWGRDANKPRRCSRVAPHLSSLPLISSSACLMSRCWLPLPHVRLFTACSVATRHSCCIPMCREGLLQSESKAT